MAKIVGNTVGIPNPQSDWNQTDKTKADYIRNKPDISVPPREVRRDGLYQGIGCRMYLYPDPAAHKVKIRIDIQDPNDGTWYESNNSFELFDSKNHEKLDLINTTSLTDEDKLKIRENIGVEQGSSDFDDRFLVIDATIKQEVGINDSVSELIEYLESHDSLDIITFPTFSGTSVLYDNINSAVLDRKFIILNLFTNDLTDFVVAAVSPTITKSNDFLWEIKVRDNYYNIKLSCDSFTISKVVEEETPITADITLKDRVTRDDYKLYVSDEKFRMDKLSTSSTTSLDNFILKGDSFNYIIYVENGLLTMEETSDMYTHEKLVMQDISSNECFEFYVQDSSLKMKDSDVTSTGNNDNSGIISRLESLEAALGTITAGLAEIIELEDELIGGVES